MVDASITSPPSATRRGKSTGKVSLYVPRGSTASASVSQSSSGRQIAMPDIWTGALLLALPQLPLTFGNALVAITSENNRLFPDRPVTERAVAISTGLANAWTSALGGVPVCHGAGGMAGHVKFGARTGGATVMVGVLLTVLALGFADSVHILLRFFPEPVLGVILFLAGAELALSSRERARSAWAAACC